MSSVEKEKSEEKGKKLIFWVCSPKNDFVLNCLYRRCSQYFFQYLIYGLYFIFNGFCIQLQDFRINFRMFPKIFPTLIFIFLFAAIFHNFFTLCRYFLQKFPAQNLLYISCFFYTSTSSQRDQRTKPKTRVLGNDLSPPVLFFVPLIYISPSLFLISYFCFLLANLLNLLQLLVIHQSKVHINLTIYLVFHHRYSLVYSIPFHNGSTLIVHVPQLWICEIEQVTAIGTPL